MSSPSSSLADPQKRRASLSAEGPDAEVQAGGGPEGDCGAVSRHVEPLDEDPPSGNRLRGLELDLR